MSGISRFFGKKYTESDVERMQEEGNIQGLIRALGNSEDSNVRRAAAIGLSKIGDERAVEPLIASLKDPECTVCIWAASALAEISDARALEPLVAALKTRHPGDKYGLLPGKIEGAIEKIQASQTAKGPLDKLLTRKWSKPLSEDTAKLAGVVLANCHSISDPAVSNCEIAIGELAMKQDTVVAEVLCYVGLVASHGRVTEAASEALKKKADPKITDVLCQALHYDRKVNPLVGSDWTLPHRALNMLRVIGDECAKGAVAGFLEDFCKSWGRGDSMFVGNMRDMMTLGAQLESEKSICIAACRALAALGGPDAAPAIKAVLSDPYWGKFDEIREHLTKLTA